MRKTANVEAIEKCIQTQFMKLRSSAECINNGGTKNLMQYAQMLFMY